MNHAQAIRAMLKPIGRRIRLLAGRGSVAAVDDAAAMQKLQLTVLQDERLPAVERVQQFGFSGNPPKGSTCVVLCMAGSRSYPLVIAVEDPATRPKNLPAGAAEIYDAAGNYLRFNADGTFYLKAATSGVVDCPQVEFKGNLTVDQNLLVKGTMAVQGTDGGGFSIAATGSIQSAADVKDATGTMATMRGQHNAHGHGNVQNGAGISAGPTVNMT